MFEDYIVVILFWDIVNRINNTIWNIKTVIIMYTLIGFNTKDVNTGETSKGIQQYEKL